MGVISYFRSLFYNKIEEVKDTVAILQKNKLPGKSILLIGSTGCGKSTFINTMANYMLSGDQERPRVCIPTKYLSATEGYSTSETDPSQTDRSQTNDCQTYNFEKLGYMYYFIDTPGQNDSRGITQDDKNLDKIIKAAQEAEELSCIVLLLNGTDGRVTASVKNLFLRLKGSVPDVALKNIIVVLTKCSKSDASLEFRTIRMNLPVVQKENVQYMNNSAFCVKPKKDGTLKVKDRMLVDAWNMSMKTCDTITHKIHTYGVVAGKCFKQMRTHRFQQRALLNKSKLEIRSLQRVMEVLERAKVAAEKSGQEVNQYKDFMIEETTVEIVQEPRDYHSTLCSQCNYNCHTGCGLSEISNRGDNAFTGCSAMNGSNYCNQCPGRCSYKVHFHGRYTFRRENKTVQQVLTDMKAKYDAATSNQDQAVTSVQTLESTRALLDSALQMQVTKLRNICEKMKNICSGFNFAEELYITLHQMKMEASVLRSVGAKAAAQDIIQAFTAITNSFSEDMPLLPYVPLDNSVISNSDDDDDDTSTDDDDDDDDEYMYTVLNNKKKNYTKNTTDNNKTPCINEDMIVIQDQVSITDGHVVINYKVTRVDDNANNTIKTNDSTLKPSIMKKKTGLKANTKTITTKQTKLKEKSVATNNMNELD